LSVFLSEEQMRLFDVYLPVDPATGMVGYGPHTSSSNPAPPPPLLDPYDVEQWALPHSQPPPQSSPLVPATSDASRTGGGSGFSGAGPSGSSGIAGKVIDLTSSPGVPQHTASDTPSPPSPQVANRGQKRNKKSGMNGASQGQGRAK
jgi:hypothetical protein